ncbi:hypothetical protein [Roseibium salinum]|uniref:Uncharacterized protein n=1 Tax=Roseibium salinum TaxID=1604349 RepID=A0ABT3R9C7_9HYPH|nr:hypothetical protein [Roseibium sp. DSM 29163]MCX2725645.1 hypothetical protein [Roseibium sp. DSM 29163]
MKRLIFISELSVVAGLLLLTAFFGVRLWIGLDPSSPLAWRAFLEMPDVIREPANLFYYGTGLPVAYCAAFFALATGVGIALMRATNHLRLRLVFFNAAVLAFCIGYGLEFFQLPVMPGSINETIASVIIGLRQFEPVQTIFLALLTVSLMNSHKDILYALAHK